jgi:hypothetical protein
MELDDQKKQTFLDQAEPALQTLQADWFEPGTKGPGGYL